jgi:hypothetical protein
VIRSAARQLPRQPAAPCVLKRLGRRTPDRADAACGPDGAAAVTGPSAWCCRICWRHSANAVGPPTSPFDFLLCRLTSPMWIDSAPPSEAPTWPGSRRRTPRRNWRCAVLSTSWTAVPSAPARFAGAARHRPRGAAYGGVRPWLFLARASWLRPRQHAVHPTGILARQVRPDRGARRGAGSSAPSHRMDRDRRVRVRDQNARSAPRPSDRQPSVPGRAHQSASTTAGHLSHDWLRCFWRESSSMMRSDASADQA